jgi:uncharacterized beta-barrel protein YwiB (DUF1934 family)
MQIPLYIKSTIHTSGSEEAEVVKQQVQADMLRFEDHSLISYQEGNGVERSDVKIFAYEDHMIISRRGPISYQQEYQPNDSTLCNMKMPMGIVEMRVLTHFYQFNPRGKILCQFNLEQDDVILGEYQLDIAWEV